MRIDNKRIRSLAPREFEQYAGLTCLFVNPGRSLPLRAGDTASERPPDLRSDVTAEELSLFNALYTALLEFKPTQDSHMKGPALLADALGVCTMPANTYHVTACDFLHDENIYADTLRGVFREAVAILPPVAAPSLPGTVPLRRSLPKPLKFRFSSLGLRGADTASKKHCAALVAYLVPTLSCAGVYRWWERERRRIDDEWEPLGRVPSGRWTPHVTLGYVAHSYYFRRIQELIPVWEEEVRKKAKRKSITFTEARLYAFADMARFWLCPVASAARSGGKR